MRVGDEVKIVKCHKNSSYSHKHVLPYINKGGVISEIKEVPPDVKHRFNELDFDKVKCITVKFDEPFKVDNGDIEYISGVDVFTIEVLNRNVKLRQLLND